jgi:hypothetical protein
MKRIVLAAIAILSASPACASGVPLTSLANHPSPAATDVMPIAVAGSSTLLNISMAQLASYFGTGGAGTPGGINGQLQYNNAGALAGFNLAGDCTFSAPSITCLKTGGVSFAASATTDTTNAANITSGALGTARLGSGTASSSTFLRGDQTWATVSATPGGTAGQLQYNNSGALGGLTLAGDCTLSAPNITCTKTNGVAFATSATTDTTNASNISTGALAAARLAAGAAAANLGFTPPSIHGTPTTGDCVEWYGASALADTGSACGAGAGTVTTTGSPVSGNLARFSGATSITAGNLSGDCVTSGTLAITCTKTSGAAFAASATTDTTNAANITSGTVPTARLGSGTASSSTYLRGDQTWATVSAGGVTASGTPTVGNCASWTGSSSIQDAGSPCGSGAMALLATITTTAGDTSETFSSIPSSYSGLEIDFQAADSANSGPSVTLQINGQTGSCYAYQYIGSYQGSGGIFSGYNTGVTSIVLGNLTGQATSSVAAPQSQYVIKLNNYSSSTNAKTLSWTGMSSGTTLNAITGVGATICSSGGAIASIKISTAGSGLVAGGVFKLYGLQ